MVSNTFYSQQGEDVFIYNNFINLKNSTGVFVELGGFDGQTYSNTKFFEDTLSFSGILIEPTESQFKKMVSNRPNCICYNYAISYDESESTMIGDHATAGLSSYMTDSFKQSHHTHSTTFSVKSIPLSTILKKEDVKYIDFLSIDVEGAELVVLETFDFNLPTYVICIELDGHNKEKDEKCRTLLSNQGFALASRFSINEFWVNRSYYRIPALFDERLIKKKFNNIYDFGRFNYIEPHCVPLVFTALRNSTQTPYEEQYASPLAPEPTTSQHTESSSVQTASGLRMNRSDRYSLSDSLQQVFRSSYRIQ